MKLSQLSNNEEIKLSNLNKFSLLYNDMQKLLTIHNTIDETTKKAIANEKLKVELLTNVSHDLKTPLTSIIGYCSILYDMPLHSEALNYIEKLDSKAQYLNELLEDIIDLSKISSGSLILQTFKLDLIKILHQTIDEMEDRINTLGFTLIEKFNLNVAMSFVDGSRIHRVFYNLLDNALKYSLHGSRIFIYLELENSFIKISFINTASYIIFIDTDKMYPLDNNKTSIHFFHHYQPLMLFLLNKIVSHNNTD